MLDATSDLQKTSAMYVCYTYVTKLNWSEILLICVNKNQSNAA